MVTIFCDGVFDLFHEGHLKHLKKIKKYFKSSVHLIVGLINDKTAEQYKRRPIINETDRKKILLSCKYVDSVVLMDRLIIDETFIKTYNIDFIFHAFLNKNDLIKQNKFYEIPRKLNKFIEIEYNNGISTTEILKNMNLNWKDIWEKKGTVNTQDLYLLNGWENTKFNPELFISTVVNKLTILKDNSIIEIGCGSGLLSQYLTEFDYYGLDKSSTLVNKHISLLKNIVLNFDATETVFKDKYFDFCLCHSMLEYLKNTDELNMVIGQMERITKKGIYIGSIRYKTRQQQEKKHKYNGVFTHFIVQKQYFIDRGYTIVDNLFEPSERYDVFKIF